MGTPSQEDINFCLDHMRAWLKLALAEVRAEFPDSEVAQALRVLNVANYEPDLEHAPAAWHEQVQRLARAFDVDETELGSQICLHSRMVRIKLAATGCDSKAAWVEVLNDISRRRPCTRVLLPDGAIRPVVARWLAFVVSTSGVEQGFTSGMIAVTDRQGNASIELERAYLKLKVDAKRDDADVICKLAQSVWATCIGTVRASGIANRCTAIDARLRPKRRVDKALDACESAFLRARRARFRTPSTRSMDTIEDGINSLEVACWTDAHEKELQFANEKRKSRCVDAARENTFTGEGMAESTAAAERKLLDNAQKRDKVALRQLTRLEGGPLPVRADLWNMTAHVEVAAWAVHLISWNLRLTDHSQAQVFVVQDPVTRSPADKIHWAVALRGGFVINLDVLNSGPNPVCLKYEPALTSRRRLYVGDGFTYRHNRLCHTILACIENYANCKWKAIANLDTYNATRGNSGVLALVTRDDIARGDLRSILCVVGSSSFIQCIVYANR